MKTADNVWVKVGDKLYQVYVNEWDAVRVDTGTVVEGRGQLMVEYMSFGHLLRSAPEQVAQSWYAAKHNALIEARKGFQQTITQVQAQFDQLLAEVDGIGP